MDSEQCAQVVTDVVDNMRYTPIDGVLISADPGEALHAAAVDGKPDETDVPIALSALGVCEYRRIDEEFWFVLATVALSEGYTKITDGKGDDGSEAKELSFPGANRCHTPIQRRQGE